MGIRVLEFKQVEKMLRKKKFGFLGSITSDGRAHIAGVMYAVSPPKKKFCLYIITGATVKKTQNIRANPQVSFGIPFSHHIIRFAPDFCIQFQGRAEILPFNDPEGQEAIMSRRIMKMMLTKIPLDSTDEVFIRIIPDKKIHGFGLGLSFFKLIKNIESGRFMTKIPDELFNKKVKRFHHG